MKLKKLVPFCFSIPILVFAIVVMYCQYKSGDYLTCGLAGLYFSGWFIGVHVTVDRLVNRTGTAWAPVDDSMFAKYDHFTSSGALLYNTNGLPMLNGGAIDIAGNPIGATSSDWMTSNTWSDSWSSTSSSSYDSSRY